MTGRFSISLLAALLLVPAFFARAQTAPAPHDVTLFFVADAKAPAAKTLKSDDPALAAAKPHPEKAKADIGWMFFESKETVAGWVPANATRKDLTARAGTPVYQSPSKDSPILGPATDDPPVKVIGVEGDWAKVDYPGPVTYYFIGVVAKRPVPAPPAPAPHPVVRTPPPAPVPFTATPITAVPAGGTTTADLPRYYAGTLQLRTDLKIGGPVNAKYLLLGANGELIALVDLDGVILTSPVTAYLGRPVQVYGVAIHDPSFPAAMLKAQLVQLSQ